MPSRVRPGIPRTAEPQRRGAEPEQCGQLLPVAIDELSGHRRGGADQQRDEHQGTGGAKSRESCHSLQVLLDDVEAADHDREREPGNQRGRQHDAVDRGGVALIVVDDRRHQPGYGHPGGNRERDERPPSGAPSKRRGQHAAEQRTEEVRHTGSGSPDAERVAASLGREARDGAGERGRADEAGSGALHYARRRAARRSCLRSRPRPLRMANSARPRSASRRAPNRSTSSPPGISRRA